MPEYIAMYLGHAVHIGAGKHCKARHVYLTAGSYLHAVYLLLAHAHGAQLGILHLVYARYYIHQLRRHAPEQVIVPLLQRLAHYGMVCIAEGLAGNVKGGVKVQALIHKQPDKLGYGYRRVGIVELYGAVGGKVGKVVAAHSLIPANYILQ